MRHFNVFHGLTSADGRLGFYTKESRNRIPEFPGCYAWFLPLWLYREDLDEFIRLVSTFFSYEETPEKEVEAPFTWESVNLRVRRSARIRANDENRTTWQRILSNHEAKDALQQVLMEATLLTPPLYVGRTNNLKRRYLQHTGGDRDKNTFRARFTDHVAKYGFKIGVSDLLFICIQTQKDVSRIFDDLGEKNLNLLIEQILTQFCRPPFSLR